MGKNILILVGSPRIGGNTDRLSEAFIKGTLAVGNYTTKINVADKNINYCIGCRKCKTHEKGCVQKDDMFEIYDAIKVADMVIFASPLYYWSFPAQLKTVIDRMYALGYHKGSQYKRKECGLIMVAGSNESEIFSQIVSYYKFGFVHRLGWIDKGVVLIGGILKNGDLEKTDGIEKAYNFGISIE